MKRKIAICCLLSSLLFACIGPDNNKAEKISKAGSKTKVALIGFDAAKWPYLDYAVENGLMPNLKKLMDSGCRAELKTLHPTLTPVIWTSISTGKKPEKHGILSPVSQFSEGKQMRPALSVEKKVRDIWTILSENDIESCIVRYPVSYPASPIKGAFVTDYAFIKERPGRTYPDSVTEVVDRNFHSSYLKDIESLTGINEEKYKSLDPQYKWKLFLILSEYQSDIRFKNVALDLLKEGQKPFTAIYLYSLDAVGHNFYRFFEIAKGNLKLDEGEPDFTNIIPNWCWFYDQILKEILDSMDPDTTVIVCSDHGMELALEPQNFLIQEAGTTPLPPESAKSTPLPEAPAYASESDKVHHVYTLPTGQHTDAPNGVFLISGPGIRKASRLESAQVFDIAPTILQLFGMPIAEDFDGNPLVEAFTDEYAAAHPTKTIPTYETGGSADSVQPAVPDYSQSDESMIDRLRALGYIN